MSFEKILRIIFFASESKMEPTVAAAPSQSWDQAWHKISENKVEEEQSDAAWKFEQCQEHLEESPEHLMGVVKGNILEIIIVNILIENIYA